MRIVRRRRLTCVLTPAGPVPKLEGAADTAPLTP